jgi:hypothetical protein
MVYLEVFAVAVVLVLVGTKECGEMGVVLRVRSARMGSCGAPGAVVMVL